MKECRTCKKTKDEFRKGRGECKDCERKKGREYRRNNNKAKEWVEKNKKRMRELQHNHYEKNKQKIREKEGERMREEPKFKQQKNHKHSLGQFIKNKIKSSIYSNIDKEVFIKWLKFSFEDGMSFDNYNKVWTLDHVIPINEYLNGDVEEKIILNGINTQPVFKEYNLKKNKHICLIQLENHKNKYTEFCNVNKLDINNEYITALNKYLAKPLVAGNSLEP